MQLEFFDVPSPCIGICQSDEKGYCLGCMRTRVERQSWIGLNLNAKQKLIKRCVQRKKRKEGKGKIKVVIEEPTVVQPSLLDPLSIPSTPKIDNYTARKPNTDNATENIPENTDTKNTPTNNTNTKNTTTDNSTDFDFIDFEL